MRGYCGIGIYEPLYGSNVAGLWRSAYVFKATFVFTVGTRYGPHAADTPKTPRHIPLFHFTDLLDAYMHFPREATLVGVEQDQGWPLKDFVHPERAIYLFGSERFGLPDGVRDHCHTCVHVETPSPYSLNVASVGSIILYDRIRKRQ